MNLIWHDNAWEDYLWFQANDRRLLKRINQLIRDVQRDPTSGVGKPEVLRDDLSGWMSRRVDSEHRLVYRVMDDNIEIAQCRYHYTK